AARARRTSIHAVYALRVHAAGRLKRAQHRGGKTYTPRSGDSGFCAGDEVVIRVPGPWHRACSPQARVRSSRHENLMRGRSFAGPASSRSFPPHVSSGVEKPAATPPDLSRVARTPLRQCRPHSPVAHGPPGRVATGAREACAAGSSPDLHQEESRLSSTEALPW